MSDNTTNQFDSLKIIGSILYIIGSFVIPVFGILLSIILLKKAKNKEFPSWVKGVAIIAIIYQIVLIVLAILGGVFFVSLQDNVEITTEVQSVLME